MASSSQYTMSGTDREFLRKNRQYLIENLNVDDVWPRMPHVFDKNLEDKIRAEQTPQLRIIKFLDLLPGRGPEAFNAFIVAAYQSQKYLGEYLAKKAGINLNDILPAEDENSCMKRVHREVLRHYLPEFSKTLDVQRMMKSLLEARIINSIRNMQVENLILDVLPKSGPDAFNTFFNALKMNQPQFYIDLEQLIKRSHPDITLGKCYQESSHASNVAGATNSTYTLTTPCSKLPEEVLRIAAECLDPPNELFENDWKRFYKVLKLPEGKENVIAEKDGSPTRHVIKIWIDRDGKQATMKKLLEALGECKQGGLAHRIEQILGVELPVGCDFVDAVENMRIEENDKKKAIRIVKDIPEDLKQKFIDRLNELEVEVLSTIATAVSEERCYVRDAADFLDKIRENKTRILFRQLRKANQCDMIVLWMRKNFPAGSTGPMKSDDELRAGDMNYGRRLEVTKILTAKGSWKMLAAHKDINMSTTDIGILAQKAKGGNSDPSEDVLSYWEVRSRSTVGTMYDLLVDCEFFDVADRL